MKLLFFIVDFRMNSKLNSNLFWSAIHLTGALMLRWTTDSVASLLILFIGLISIYQKEDFDVLYAGIYLLIIKSILTRRISV